ncbi:hypothetical protein [Streptomyces sp. NBC_01237]|uniref:hypothetical protein n=1 Tax=Streptomyces sp. NBC_01237 TaxID=2903790 RepID=UPI002DD8E94C|nr:hypothetical protein [Streptomyces sp. NBC_01237]WRZ72893.1 hypothetical protein OG251_15350 [Streptomyces sp. NBC_01237]
MPIYAGQIITEGQLNRMQPRAYLAEATGPLIATTTYQLIPGCTLTVPTTVPGATWSATGVFDCNVTTAHLTNLMVGRLTVNGSSQSGLAVHAMDTLDRDTVAMLWSGTLAAAGNHVFNMEGVINGAGGTGSFFAYSRLAVTITEPV